MLGWKAPTRLTASEWADQKRMLSPEASAEPGKWNTSRAEYQRGMMDAFTDPRVETIVIMGCSQFGKTEILNNIVGYHIDQEPCPILLVMPTLELGQAWSKDRFSPMLRDTPCLQGKVKEVRSKNSNNTIMHKVFPGGHITIAGANSAASLAARPIRIVLCDEIDRYPGSAGTEGDPVNLAFKRATTFWNRKLIVTSTPTIRGLSRIEKFYDGSDKRMYYVPCPHCGEFQLLRWKNIKFERDKDGNVTLAVLVCEYCQKHITDADKPLMLRKGQWRAEAPFTKTAGFHINELYSPWVTFEQTVQSFLEAKKDPLTLRVWVNTALGETYEEDYDEGISHGLLYGRREAYPTITEDGKQKTILPDGVIVLTAGVDVQDDRLEIEVVGWGIGEESWNIDYRILRGNLAKQEVWQQLDDVLLGTYQNKDGIRLHISSTCIDTAGHFTKEAYSFVKPRQTRRVFAVKGANEHGKPVVGRPSLNNLLRVKLFPIGTDTTKEVIFTRLKIQEFGPGYMHFPLERDEEYFSQLTSEKPHPKFIRGRQVRVWVKKRARNEALDCRVYALGALYILNPNLELIAERMAKRAEQTEKKDEEVEQKTEKKKPPRRPGGFVRNW